MSKHTPSLWRLSMVSLLLYAVDMGCAVAGFIYGFGLNVRSWFAVLGFMVLSRWIFHVVHYAWRRTEDEARKTTGAQQ